MPRNSTSQLKRNRLYAIIALVVIVAAVALPIEIVRRQQGLAASTQNIQAQTAAYNASLQLTNEQRDRTLERAKFLRDKWRPWAVAHKEDLRRMLSAKLGDSVAFTAVWDAVPAVPINSSDSLRLDDLETGGEKNVKFSWNALDKNAFIDPNVPGQEVVSRSKIVLPVQLKMDFENYHDIQLCSSLNTGNSFVCLWVSGRVTVGRYSQNSSIKVNDTLRIAHEDHQEVVPPFDFLQPLHKS